MLIKYNLGEPEQPVDVPTEGTLPSPTDSRWMFSHKPVAGTTWVACWAADEAGGRWPATWIPFVSTGQVGGIWTRQKGQRVRLRADALTI